MANSKLKSVLTFLRLFPNTEYEHNLVFNRKQRVKSGITRHKKRPGRNHPAKGYNQETKEWEQ